MLVCVRARVCVCVGGVRDVCGVKGHGICPWRQRRPALGVIQLFNRYLEQARAPANILDLFWYPKLCRRRPSACPRRRGRGAELVADGRPVLALLLQTGGGGHTHLCYAGFSICLALFSERFLKLPGMVGRARLV